MPEERGERGEESWTQTLITITPEENAAMRTIIESTVISAVGDTPVVLGVNQIADRRMVQTNRMMQELFVGLAELQEIVSHGDAECQTFLRGVPKVELPSALRNEATQTMYLGNISLYNPRPFKDVAKIMNDRITPVAAKMTEQTQTVLTAEPDTPRNLIVERLTVRVTPEELRESNCAEPAMAAPIYVRDNLYFVLDRVLWLSDPGYSVPAVQLKDEVAQTCIKYDHSLAKIVLDADTQTSLTCEPRRSNAGLLSAWSATKEFVRSLIEEFIETGVCPRTTVRSILDEVVERCAGQIRPPYRDETVQTLAPCNVLRDRDVDVLKKLRLAIVLDTLESSIIVLPLVEIFVLQACVEVRQRAPIVVAEILNRIQKNSSTIAAKLAAIREEAALYRPMEGIFDARKKRLRELLKDKTGTKLCSSTQTDLAGVPNLIKIKEPRETVCSACGRHSECYACETRLDVEQTKKPTNARTSDPIRGKILKTQDILIAYNPCYIAATPSKITEIQPPVVPKQLPASSSTSRQLQPLSTAKPRTSASSTSWRDPKIERWYNSGLKSAKLKTQGEDQGRELGSSAGPSSLTDWARVARNNSSIYGSSSAESNGVPKPAGTELLRKASSKECTRPRRDLSVCSINALRILKNTFNRNEESCSDCYHDQGNLDDERGQEGGANARSTISTDRGRGKSSNERLYGEGIRVVPIIRLSNQNNGKR